MWSYVKTLFWDGLFGGRIEVHILGFQIGVDDDLFTENLLWYICGWEHLLYSALIFLLVNKVSGSTIFYGNMVSTVVYVYYMARLPKDISLNTILSISKFWKFNVFVHIKKSFHWCMSKFS